MKGGLEEPSCVQRRFSDMPVKDAPYYGRREEMKKVFIVLMIICFMACAAGMATSGNASVFFKAASGGDVATVKSELQKNPKLAKVKDKKGKTALQMAAFNGHDDVITVLLGAGAEVNSRDAGGRTALMKATFNGHLSTVQLLVSKGADVNAKNNDGKTALMVANGKGNKNIADFLRKSGAK
jgi:ankyrin repeat protein